MAITSHKFPYAQFPATNTKGADIFPLVRQVIKHLIRLRLVVAMMVLVTIVEYLQCLIPMLIYYTKLSMSLVQTEELISLFLIFPISLTQFATVLQGTCRML